MSTIADMYKLPKAKGKVILEIIKARNNTMSEFTYKYDDKGNVVCIECIMSTGHRSYRYITYDENSNPVYERSCNKSGEIVSEWWKEYDKNNNCIKYTTKDHNPNDLPEYEISYEYDNDGNMIHCKHSTGYEERHSIYADGYVTHEEFSDAGTIWSVFNDKKDPIFTWDEHEGACVITYKYDSSGKIIELVSTAKYESHKETFKYDDNGNLIGHILDGDIITIFEYDDNNNRVHCKNPQSESEAWYEYNEHGDIIHEKLSSGLEKFIEYSYV